MTAASQGAGRLAGLNVLVAEDSFPIALVIETALEAEGAATVGPVASLEEARRLAGDSEVDLAVVDLQLGDQSALDLIHQLAGAGVTTVVATGRELDQEMQTMVRGITVLKKPYTAAQLVETLKGALERTSMRGEC